MDQKSTKINMTPMEFQKAVAHAFYSQPVVRLTRMSSEEVRRLTTKEPKKNETEKLNKNPS